MKVLVVGNPIAGSGRGGHLINEVSRCLESMGCEVDVVTTRGKGDACEAASRCRADRIVSVGGDGTVHEIVNGLAGRDVPLAVVPAGTANLLARELALPGDVESICRAVHEGRETVLDACVIEGNRFLLAVGIGFDAHVVHAVAAARKGTLSYASYVWPIVNSWMRYVPEPFCVEVDGSVMCEDAMFCVISNVKNYIWSWRMTPSADPSDGLIDIMVFRGTKKSRFAGFVISFALQRHFARDDVMCVQGRSVRAFSPSCAQVPVHTDGDPAGYLPIDAEVAPCSVRVLGVSHSS